MYRQEHTINGIIYHKQLNSEIALYPRKRWSTTCFKSYRSLYTFRYLTKSSILYHHNNRTPHMPQYVISPLKFVNIVQRVKHLQVRSDSDLTGTKIKSTKPLAVFSGSEWTSVGYKQMGDHLVEQMPPTSTWGKLFITASIATRQEGDVFRVLGGSHLSHYLLTYLLTYLRIYLLTNLLTFSRT